MAEFNFKNIFLAGVGATAYSMEKAAEMVDELVKKGELTVQQGKAVNDELKHNMSDHLRTMADNIENAGRKAGDFVSGVADDLAGEVAETAVDILDKVEEMTAEQRAALRAKLEQMDQRDEED